MNNLDLFAKENSAGRPWGKDTGGIKGWGWLSVPILMAEDFEGLIWLLVIGRRLVCAQDEGVEVVLV